MEHRGVTTILKGFGGGEGKYKLKQWRASWCGGWDERLRQGLMMSDANSGNH